MKRLKIEDNKGYFKTDQDWTEIDQISKDDLMFLLDKAVEEDEFELDEYDADKLANKAHAIIYKNIFEKFSDFLDNKTRFKDESQTLYKEAFEKYSVQKKDKIKITTSR